MHLDAGALLEFKVNSMKRTFDVGLMFPSVCVVLEMRKLWGAAEKPRIGMRAGWVQYKPL